MKKFYSFCAIVLITLAGAGCSGDSLMTELQKLQADAIDNGDSMLVRFNNSIYFENRSDVLTEDGRSMLKKIVSILDRYSDYKIQINGHTDDLPISTDQFSNNHELSHARAEMAKKFMSDQGIDNERLVARGFGDDKPVVANDSEQNRAKNRRVEFVFKSIN